VAALFAKAAVGEDVAAGAIGEIGRLLNRAPGDVGRKIGSRPRGQPAGNMQRFQETFGDRVGLAAGKTPLAGGAVQTLDRHHVGNTEACEGITHVPFPDKAAQVGELCHQRLDRLALAAQGIADVIGQDRAGDLHFDGPGKGPRRQAIAGAGFE
jgi:hypothetical protein